MTNRRLERSFRRAEDSVREFRYAREGPACACEQRNSLFLGSLCNTAPVSTWERR
jgi:hypothetical protein